MRKTMVLILLALVFGTVGLQAQSANVVCGDLDEADCALLIEAQENLAGLSSYGVNITGAVSISNIPDLPGDINIALAGTGAISGDLSGIHMSQEEAMALSTDPEAAFDFIAAQLQSVNAEALVTITLPDELVAQSDGQLPAAIPLELRLVDGVAYLNFDALRGALGQQGENLPAGWYGLDLQDLFERLMAMSDAMGIEPMDPEIAAHFSDLDRISEFVSVERLDDTTAADGTEVASFHTVIDYAALMTAVYGDPAMRDLLEEAMAEQGQTLTDEEMDRMIGMMQQIFQGVTFEVFQTVGLEDRLPRSVQVTFNWNLQPMVDAMIEAGEGDLGLEGPAPRFSLNLTQTYRDFDQIDEIIAPEDATIVPLDALMSGMTGMSGMSELQAAPAEDVEVTPTAAG